MVNRAVSTLLTAVLLAGCAASPATTAVPTGAVPDADRAAVTATIDAINNAAAGPVADQQAVLGSLIDPALAAEQRACAPASITIRIDPVLDRLAEDTDTAATERADTSETGFGTTTPSGSVYRVPVLLEVYTDGLRTGTDLTNFKLFVSDGIAHTFPLCLV